MYSPNLLQCLYCTRYKAIMPLSRYLLPSITCQEIFVANCYSYVIHLSSFYKEGNIEESNFVIQWLCELFSMNIYIWSIESQTFSLMLHSMIVSSKMLYLMCEPLTSSHPHFHLLLEFHSRDSCVN